MQLKVNQADRDTFSEHPNSLLQVSRNQSTLFWQLGHMSRNDGPLPEKYVPCPPSAKYRPVTFNGWAAEIFSKWLGPVSWWPVLLSCLYVL